MTEHQKQRQAEKEEIQKYGVSLRINNDYSVCGYGRATTAKKERKPLWLQLKSLDALTLTFFRIYRITFF